MKRLAMAMVIGAIAVGVWYGSPKRQENPILKSAASPEPRNPPPITESNTSPAPLMQLAQSGTPAEVDALLSHLERTTDEARRVELRQIIASVFNRASEPHLIDRLANGTDPVAALGLQQAILRMADLGTVERLAARYDTATDEGALRIAEIIERIDQPECVLALARIASDPKVQSRDRLTLAALRALARIGTPFAAATLIRRLDAAPADEEAGLTSLIASINRAGAQEDLIRSARGEQDATRSVTRIAAIKALRNYRDAATRSAVESLAKDADPRVAASAKASLQY